MKVGRNVEAEIDSDSNTLHIIIDLSEAGERSASGKSMVIATTNGNVKLDGTNGATLGFNLYRKA